MLLIKSHIMMRVKGLKAVEDGRKRGIPGISFGA